MTFKKRFHQFLSPHPSPGVPLSSSGSSSSSCPRLSLSSSSSRTEEEPNDYHIVLIDIKETVEKRRIECTKKLMDEPGLRYCAISYRWGEVSEQVAVTPDYVAHVTSFALADLELLCGQLLISKEHVDYVWVDAICIDQLNDRARKSAIRQMNRIYDHATMILAVPDLHASYLKMNPRNKSILTRLRKHTPDLYRHITMHHNDTCECVDKSCIEFLQYLVEDWSNRVWVISEYHIGRQKNMKLWFLSFDIQWYYTTRPGFVPLFDCIYRNHFRHRPFLDMMLHSQAKRNEDRFYAILPTSVKYKDCIKTQDTVSQWQVTDKTSVCLRLYTFVGLREKTAMLYNCSKGRMLVLPSFASCYNNDPSTLTKILDLQRDRLLVQSIVLMTPTVHGPHDHPSRSHTDRAYLQLKAKCHRVLSIANKETKMFWRQHAKICQQLEWTTRRHHGEKYQLDQVFIPFIEAGIRTPFGIHLVGDRRVNRWIVHQLTIINVNVPATEWRLVDQIEEFHIY